MIEILTHSLGICGDNHPNVFLLYINGIEFSTYKDYIINQIKQLCQ